MIRFVLLFIVVVLSACVGEPAAKPAPGMGSLWGYVRLARREGIKPIEKNDPVYADRRLPEQELVDYRKAGFVVVYLEGPPSPEGMTLLALEAAKNGRVGFRPERAAVGTRGKIVIKNTDALPHTVSCPRAGLIRELKPGDEVMIDVAGDGPWTFFTLEGTGGQGMVFAAPGPYTVALENGHWALTDLPAGSGTLHAWHPRLPAAQEDVQVQSGVITRADLDVGVDNLSKETMNAPEIAR